MSRNATASWSGYCHQGKVGLLVALKKIKALNLQQLNNHSMELETQEDVKIANNNIVVEVHQVKAYKGSDRLSAYTSALKAFEDCIGGNYLHTVCEISNWGDMVTADNPKGVTRYLYSAGKTFCDLDDIDKEIIDEIAEVLVATGNLENSQNEDWCRSAFKEYLAVLDEKIRYEHRHKAQVDYEVKFSLDEILNLICEQPTRCKAVTFAIRQSIYNEYVQFVLALEEAGYPGMTAEQEDIVTKVIKHISHMDDIQLEDFLIKVFPASTVGKSLAQCVLTSDFYSPEAFVATFLNTLIHVDRQQLLLEDGIYPHYKVDLNYLLTAIHSNEQRKPAIAMFILKNRKLNAARYETDYIINETYDGSLEECAGRVVPTKGLFNPKEIKFISRQNAIDTLNQ